MSSNEKEYCLISKEVILLLEWIIKNDIKILETIIKKLWKNGLSEAYSKKYEDENSLDQVRSQEIVFTFFNSLEKIIKKIEIKDKKKKKTSQLKNNNILINLEKNILFNKNENIDESKEKSTEEKKEIYKKFLKYWNPKNTFTE